MCYTGSLNNSRIKCYTVKNVERIFDEVFSNVTELINVNPTNRLILKIKFSKLGKWHFDKTPRIFCSPVSLLPAFLLPRLD